MKILIFFYLLAIGSGWSQTVTSTIHSIDIDPDGSNHFLRLHSGEVIFIDEKILKDDLLRNIERDETIDFNLDKNHELLSWSSRSNGQYTTSPEYTPSIVQDRSQLLRIFEGLRKDSRRRSECYHRAYIWAYEEFKKSDLQLTKHFLFFTRKYIREYRYKWWFHVAPSILFEEEDGSQNFLIFDRSFMKEAAPVKEWTDKFIASKRNCPVVYVYSHYNNNQNTEHCYLIPTPMYYLQPLDIENFEKTGIEKTNFHPWDLNISYRRGFSGPRL